jgi:hypothetical protein
MTTSLKLLLAGMMVAVAFMATNLTGGTPSANAQTPYCQVNPSMCTPSFCAAYPGVCNQPVNPWPVYPVVNPYPVYPVQVAPINCAPVPYSAIYGTLYRPPCTYPLAYPYGVCTYNAPCNRPFVGGTPARINLAVSPAIATCGSTPVTVAANVTDAFGVAVANGTGVSFSSTIGSIGGASTIGGNATATLTIPAGSTAGIAHITVRAGGASASSTVQVNCAPVVQQIVVQQVTARPNPATVIYQQAPTHRPAPQQQPVIIQRGPAPRPAAPYIPPFAPPRTGEAGLTDAILAAHDDADANQALISAARDYDYGVLDASQYDWIVIADDSAANVQLATDLIDQAYSVIDAAQADVIVIADDTAATTSLVIDVLSNPADYGN